MANEIAEKKDGNPVVRLTAGEERFLARLTDPFLADASPHVRDRELDVKAAVIGLREEDVDYIREWVLCHGIHWLTCDSLKLDPRLGARVFRNPIVRRIINAAAAQGLCLGTSAFKDELEDYFTQRMRDPALPETIRDNAAMQIAKLKGFYPDNRGAQGGSAAVQIVINDPYGRVEAKAVNG